MRSVAGFAPGAPGHVRFRLIPRESRQLPHGRVDHVTRAAVFRTRRRVCGLDGVANIDGGPEVVDEMSEMVTEQIPVLRLK